MSRWTMPWRWALASPLSACSGEVERLGDRQPPVLLDRAPQGLAVVAGHGEVEPLLLRLAHLVDGAEVGMVERRGGPRLLEEAGLGHGVARQLGRQELERDGAPEARVLGLVDACPCRPRPGARGSSRDRSCHGALRAASAPAARAATPPSSDRPANASPGREPDSEGRDALPELAAQEAQGRAGHSGKGLLLARGWTLGAARIGTLRTARRGTFRHARMLAAAVRLLIGCARAQQEPCGRGRMHIDNEIADLKRHFGHLPGGNPAVQSFTASPGTRTV